MAMRRPLAESTSRCHAKPYPRSVGFERLCRFVLRSTWLECKPEILHARIYWTGAANPLKRIVCCATPFPTLSLVAAFHIRVSNISTTNVEIWGLVEEDERPTVRRLMRQQASKLRHICG